MSPQTDARELFQRFEGNPILSAADFPKMVNAVFNPGATEFEGRTLLLLRVEHRTGDWNPTRITRRSAGGSRTRG